MGWLGWTYEQTVQHSPAQIEAAVRGRKQMLRAVFGGKEQPGDTGVVSMKDGASVQGFMRGMMKKIKLRRQQQDVE